MLPGVLFRIWNKKLTALRPFIHPSLQKHYVRAPLRISALKAAGNFISLQTVLAGYTKTPICRLYRITSYNVCYTKLLRPLLVETGQHGCCTRLCYGSVPCNLYQYDLSHSSHSNHPDTSSNRWEYSRLRWYDTKNHTGVSAGTRPLQFCR